MRNIPTESSLNGPEECSLKKRKKNEKRMKKRKKSGKRKKESDEKVEKGRVKEME